MALLTIEGIYADGKVRLLEAPSGVSQGSRVIVTFLPADETQTAEEAENTPEGDESRAELLARISARMAKGVDLGGPPYPKREEVYDRLR